MGSCRKLLAGSRQRGVAQFETLPLKNPRSSSFSLTFPVPVCLAQFQFTPAVPALRLKAPFHFKKCPHLSNGTSPVAQRSRIHLQCRIAGDTGSMLWEERSLGGGNGNPPQYSCLKNTMDRGAWRAAVHGVTERAYRLRILVIKDVVTLAVKPCGHKVATSVHR